MADELSFDITANDKASDTFKKVGESSAQTALKIEQANIRVEKATRAATAAESKYGKGSLEARDAAAKLASAQLGVSKAMAKTEQAAESSAGGIDKMKGALTTLGAVGVAGAVGAAIARALDIDAGVKKLQGQLGATNQEAARYGKIAGELYGSNFGENLDQVNEAIRNVRQNIGQLGDTGSNSMKSITADVLSTAQAFDVDLFDVTKAVGTQLRSGLAPDAKTALDTIVYGLQKVPGAGEDLLDTLTEYDVQFKSLGLNGEQSLAFIAAAMQGGARNTDLAADALKEFNLRARDTTNTGAQKALQDLGLNAQTVAQQIAGGGNSATQAMVEVLTRLKAIPDPAKRSALATQLLGTQAEDLQGALMAVDPQQFVKGLDGIEGSASKLSETLGDTAQSRIESYQRRLEQLVVGAVNLPSPLGDAAAIITTFGAAAVSTGGSVAELAGGLALIPGAGGKAVKVLTALKTSAVALGPAFAVIGAAAAAQGIAEWVGEAQVADTNTKKLAGSLAELGRTGQLGEEGLALFQNSGAFGLLTNDADDSADALKRWSKEVERAYGSGLNQKVGRALEFGKSQGQVAETAKRLDDAFALLASSGNMDDATAAYQQFIAKGEQGGATVQELSALFPKYNAAVKDTAAKTAAAAAAAPQLNSALAEQASAAGLTAQNLDELIKKVNDYSNGVLNSRSAAREFQAAIDDADASVKENKKTLDINTAAGRANQAALDSIASSGIKLAQETPKGADAQKYFSKTLDTTRDRLIAAARKMGSTKSEARQLANEILGIKSPRPIKVTTPGMTQATSRADFLARRLNDLPTNKVITVTTRFFQVGKEPGTYGNGLGVYADGARAAGGPVEAGKTYIVGENQPELFVPKQDGYILPEVPPAGPGRQVNMTASSSASGGGQQPVVLQLIPDGSAAGTALLEILRRSIKVKGGNVQVVLGGR